MQRDGKEERVEQPVAMTCLGPMSFITLFLDFSEKS